MMCLQYVTLLVIKLHEQVVVFRLTHRLPLIDRHGYLRLLHVTGLDVRAATHVSVPPVRQLGGLRALQTVLLYAFELKTRCPRPWCLLAGLL